MPRDTIARLLAGDIVDLLNPQTPDADKLMATAQTEGVLALLGQRSSRLRNAPTEMLAELASAARSLAAAAMLRQAESRRVLDAIPTSIPVLVLKGSALALWLYPEAYLRECSDVDLLFQSRADAERAAELLVELGYGMRYRPSDLAHEFLCRRETRSVIDLDMHWKLSGEPLFQATFAFSELHEASVELPSLGVNGKGLTAVHAFAHACIHRASNVSCGIGDRLKWLYDIHLLALQFSPSDWAQLQSVCRQRQLCGVVAEAITATGHAFGTPIPLDVANALVLGRRTESLDASRLGDWRYMQRRNLMALPGWKMRARWLWQRAFPSKGYLRELYGDEITTPKLWQLRLSRALSRIGFRR